MTRWRVAPYDLWFTHTFVILSDTDILLFCGEKKKFFVEHCLSNKVAVPVPGASFYISQWSFVVLIILFSGFFYF